MHLLRPLRVCPRGGMRVGGRVIVTHNADGDIAVIANQVLILDTVRENTKRNGHT